MIGCTDDYQAMLVRQPGSQTGQGLTPQTVGSLSEIVSVTWGRVWKRYSECIISVTKCPDNCEFITSSQNWTGIDSWAHEIWLYRDGKPAWQGPIVQIRETIETSDKPGMFILTARDVVQWLYAREIREAYAQTWTSPGVAQSLVNTYFAVDDPDLVRNVVVYPFSSGDITVEYDAAQFTVGQKWDELISGGLTYSTVGRSIHIMDNVPPNYDHPFVFDADRIMGEIELVQDGLDYGNHIVGLGEGISYGLGPTGDDYSYYGKVTFPPNRFNDVKDLGQLQDITNTLYNSKRNLTPQLVVPEGSALAPDTEIYNETWTMGEENLRYALPLFIAGFRYDIRVGEQFCDPATYPMVLSELAVSWTAESEDEQREKVMVSLANMAAGEDVEG